MSNTYSAACLRSLSREKRAVRQEKRVRVNGKVFELTVNLVRFAEQRAAYLKVVKRIVPVHASNDAHIVLQDR